MSYEQPIENEMITITRKSYDELKHIYDGLTDADMFCFYGHGVYTFKTKDKALKSLSLEIELLNKQIYNLKYPNRNITIPQVKSFSLWKFWKWRSIKY